MPVDEAEVRRRLLLNPTSRPHRLICADWLSEQGDPRGDWLRNDELWPWMEPDGRHPLGRIIEMLRQRAPVPRHFAVRILPLLGAHGVPAYAELVRHLRLGQPQPGWWPSWWRRAARADEAGEADFRVTIIDTLPQLLPYAENLFSDLLNGLIDTELGVQSATESALRRLGPRLIPQLLTALAHPNPLLREAVVVVLGDLQAFAALPLATLGPMVRSANWRVRRVGVQALASPRQPHAPQLRLLETALSDRHWEVFSTARTAVRKLGPAARPLLRTLAPLALAEIVQTLVRTTHPNSMSETPLNCAWRYAGGDLTRQVNNARLVVPRWTDAHAVLMAVGATAEAVKALRPYAHRTSGHVRYACAWLLGELGPPAHAAISWLERWLTDPEVPVQLAAEEALRKIRFT
jgi:uncharacterized protein (TIGR02996 family)